MPQIFTYPTDLFPSAGDLVVKQAAGGGPGTTLTLTMRQVVETGSFTVSTADAVPRANGSGKIDNGWLNTGSGGGLDADTVDGVHASGFALVNHVHTLADITDAGTMAAQNAGAVTITGGSITGIVDIAISDGGTGASTAAGARFNLGLQIGTDIPALVHFHDAGDTTTGIFAAARIPLMIGDSGAGGVAGAVPAPGAGEAGFVLLGNGVWTDPVGVGDMKKSVYDTDDNGLVDGAEQLDDGSDVVTAAEARTHIDTLNIHRVLNDGVSTTTNLYSASHIDGLISGVASGIVIKESCRLATESDGNIDLVAGGLLTIDGVTLVAGDRVCVTDQTNTVQNGIYTAAVGAWLRTSDFDDAGEVKDGTVTFIQEGTNHAKSRFIVVSSGTPTPDVDPINWDEINALEFGTTAGTATEGNDPRVPTQDENDALVGTSGAPSTANPYVTTVDTRLPIQDENDALVGTDGTPSGANAYVTDSDPRLVQGVPLAHRASHISSGSDAFLSTDFLEAIVQRLRTTGPVDLTMGLVPDGEVLIRSGTSIVGIEPNLSGLIGAVSAASEGQSDTSLTAFTEKVTLPFTALAGNYLAWWYAEISETGVGTLEFQIQLDDATILALPNFSTNAASEWLAVAGLAILPVAAGPRFLDMDWRTSSSGTKSIRRARLVVGRIS